MTLDKLDENFYVEEVSVSHSTSYGVPFTVDYRRVRPLLDPFENDSEYSQWLKLDLTTDDVDSVTVKEIEGMLQALEGQIKSYKKIFDKYGGYALAVQKIEKGNIVLLHELTTIKGQLT